MSYLNLKSISTLIVVLTGVGLLSCTKTEYEQLKKPYNEVERFMIAGYGDIDSIPAVIKRDSILVYWNARLTPPATIKPTIIISAGATISPASGEEVAFSGTTVYTITAENGTVKKYTLAPVFNNAIPTVISMTATRTWSATTPIAITGEYFLTTGDPKNIKIYAQRVRDGFEFDLPFDTANVTATRINAYLPEMTSVLDTGAHRVYVKVGDFSSNVAPIWLSQPTMSEIISVVNISKRGSLSFGDEVVLDFVPKTVWKEPFERFYKNENFGVLSVGLQKIIPGQVINGSTYAVPADLAVSQSAGKIKLKIDPTFFASHTNSRLFGGTIRYNNVSSINGTGGSTSYQFSLVEYGGIYEAIIEEIIYANVNFLQAGQQITRGQTLTIDYSFVNNDYKEAYPNFTALRFKFKNIQTGVYSDLVVTAENITNNGSQLQFSIPATANVAGQLLVAVALNFTSANNRSTITPRQLLTTETIVTN